MDFSSEPDWDTSETASELELGPGSLSQSIHHPNASSAIYNHFSNAPSTPQPNYPPTSFPSASYPPPPWPPYYWPPPGPHSAAFPHPPDPRVALDTVTPVVINSLCPDESVSGQAASGKQKRKRRAKAQQPSKRTRAPSSRSLASSQPATSSSPHTPIAGVPGVGPLGSTPPSTANTPPSRQPIPFGSLVDSHVKDGVSASSASDVWWFMRPLQSKEKPAEFVTGSGYPQDYTDPPPTRRKIKSPAIGCRLCK